MHIKLYIRERLDKLIAKKNKFVKIAINFSKKSSLSSMQLSKRCSNFSKASEKYVFWRSAKYHSSFVPKFFPKSDFFKFRDIKKQHQA